MKSTTELSGRLLGLLLGLTALYGAANSGGSECLQFRAELGINYISNPPEILVPPETYGYFMDLDRTTVFPGTGLAGDFIIRNRCQDTLKLSQSSQSIKDFLKLEYVNHDNPAIKGIFPAKIQEVKVSYGPDEFRPEWGKTNIIPPGVVIEFDASCAWTELANMTPATLDFIWIYDNSSVALQDSMITMAKFQSKPVTLMLKLGPESRLDSIYYFNQLANYANQGEKFEDAYALCLQILRLDSLNFDAMRSAADVLWKMGRFDEALPYAQKGKSLIEDAVRKIKAKGEYVHDEDSDYYIERMNFLIDKCQRREKWQWAP